MDYTTYKNLYKPATGARKWADDINSNWDSIDNLLEKPEVANILFNSLTSDPSITSGKMWFRSDEEVMKFSPDGSNTIAFGWMF